MSGIATHDTLPVSFGADQLVAAALAKQRQAGGATLCVNHWLLALLGRPGALGSDGKAAVERARGELAQGRHGAPLSREAVMAQARQRAAQAGHPVVTTEDVAGAVLAVAAGKAPVAAREAETAAPVATYAYAPRATRPTPTLDQYGRDLTRDALEGKLPPLIGREVELQLIEEIICRHTKRNPALVGAAGTGKTAIVEGLAQRVVAGDVPDVLKGVRIVALQPSSLTAGAGIVGELESRMKAVIAEASQDGLILFIDELHSMVGSGGRPGVSDVGGLIKPALARGELSVIGATTDDEYRQLVEGDKALERRFNRVPVHELSVEQTRRVMLSHRDMLEQLRGVRMPDTIVDWLLDFADQYLKNRSFPDKGVDLVEQCIARAVVEGETSVTLADAGAVAERMVGMPVALGERLAKLELRLAEHGLLATEAVDELTARLTVTMQGLEVRPQRPNVVLLLMGRAASSADGVARAIAEELLGGRDRLVELDFAQFNDTEDLNTLVGPPPGYIGFEERRPLHALAQMPWSVLLCKNVDACHPEVAHVLQQALADGVVTERSGRRIYLSDSAVVLTADASGRAARPIGFVKLETKQDRGATAGDALRASAEKALGDDFVSQVDVICDTLPESGAGVRSWIERSVLTDLVERYRHRGLAIEWGPEVVDWIVQQRVHYPRRTDLLRVVEDALGNVLIEHLPEAGGRRQRAVVSVRDGRLEATVERGAHRRLRKVRHARAG